jgi:hypothetical protein
LLKPLKELSNALSSRDKAFIYRASVVEEVLCPPLRALAASPGELNARASLAAMLGSRR